MVVAKRAGLGASVSYTNFSRVLAACDGFFSVTGNGCYVVHIKEIKVLKNKSNSFLLFSYFFLTFFL